MSADALLTRLQGVRDRGTGRWIACCPAHHDKRPSLSVQETPDGHTLIHCFAGCDVGAILDAVGLEFSDLFPERLPDAAPRNTRPFNATDLLRALTHEVTVIGVIASDVAASKEISEATWKRLAEASARVLRAREFIDG